METKRVETEPKQYQRLKPKNPEEKLGYNEFGIGNNFRGRDFQNLIGRIISRLVYRGDKTFTIKARGKTISKAISFVDIAQRRIKGLGYIQKNYSETFIKEEEGNKEIKIPCLNVTLTLEEPEDKTGYYPPKKLEELEQNFIDPSIEKLRRDRRRGGYNGSSFRPGFRGRNRRGRGRGRSFRGNFGRNQYYNRDYYDYYGNEGYYYSRNRYNYGYGYNRRNQGNRRRYGETFYYRNPRVPMRVRGNRFTGRGKPYNDN